MRIRGLFASLIALVMLASGLATQPLAAQQADDGLPIPEPDHLIAVGFDGASIGLDLPQLETYETEYAADGQLSRMLVLQRTGDDNPVRIGVERTDLFWGLPVYFGLASITDPATGVTTSGFAAGLGRTSGNVTRIFLRVAPFDGSAGDYIQVDLLPAPPTPSAPPINPFLADSVAPIGHLNSAQTDSTQLPGPLGPTETLTADDIDYEFVGPAHFGIAISPEYPNGDRVIWSNGGDRISKVNYDTLETISELPIKPVQMTEQTSEDRIALLDSLSGADLALAAFPLAAEELFGLAGVYYALDSDNTLFVGGATSIIAYADSDPTDPNSPIVIKDEWVKPPEIGGSFAGANMTFDGKLALVTDEGWVVVVERDFSQYWAVQMVGSEIAPTWNAAKIAEGFRPGAASWVRNSAAVDPDGGIYVPSLEHMHKVVWDGTSLSSDPADGAWVAAYQNGRGIGTGATPSLMGFDGENEFVVITDGDDLMNVVLFWRNGIPADWEQIPGTVDPRIAGQQPADFDDPAITNVQTEQAVVVGGFGAAVVNNEPASIPVGFPPAAKLILVGYAGSDPAFTPMGIQKFEWDPVARRFDDAWVQPNVSSTNGVPLVSVRSNRMYTVGARNGDWTLEAIDWSNGDSAFHWVTGSIRYNTRYSGVFLDEEGRIMHSTTYGIIRYNR